MRRRSFGRVQARLLPLLILSCASCATSGVVYPARIAPGAAPTQSDLGARLDAVVAQFPSGRVVYPASSLLEKIGAGVVTLAYLAADVAQSIADQTVPADAKQLLAATRGLDASVCSERGPSPAPRDGRRHPPRQSYARVWIPVSDGGATTGDCPANSGAGHLCLAGRLALQPGKSRLILVVPGLFHSADHRYVMDIGDLLYAQGHSVLLIDVRAHGQTFWSQPWAETTLGLREGSELLAVARRVRDVCPDAVQDVGALGFSGGGLFAMRAFAAQPEVLRGGVLAVSPPLDLAYTIETMSNTQGDGDPQSCFMAAAPFSPCLAEGGIGHYFMELLRRRQKTLSEKGLMGAPRERVTATEFMKEHVIAKHGDPRRAITPVRLAHEIRKAEARRSGTSLVILTSRDDPVVGDKPAAELAGELGMDKGQGLGKRSVRLYRLDHGGHIAFPVVYPGLFPRFIRTLFCHGAPCADEAAR